MLNIKSLLSAVLFIVLLSSIQSFADTFEVTNLNDSGEGSLRQAITNSNLNPGPDEIDFEEALEGTIFLNVGPMLIQDDLTINGPGGGRITIDADAKSNILDINDGDDGKNSIVNINGLRFINGIADTGSEIDNFENLTVNSCQFLNGNASIAGGAINNRRFLSVESCMFENNSAEMGGAIFNSVSGIILSIDNSEFRFNGAEVGGAIGNENIIESITSSTFNGNSGFFGGAVSNESGTIEKIADSTFSGNSGDDGGAINNESGTIEEIANNTFAENTADGQGGAIFNLFASMEEITNCTFGKNTANFGGALYNDGGTINISFTTIAGNMAGIVGGGLFLENDESIIRLRNSILADNTPENCGANNSDTPLDRGGNYSDDDTCGFTDGSSMNDATILLGPLAFNGGPTQTMDLFGGDPIDGATVNCDALNENGNPTGIPIGVDQRYFPRPFGLVCDSGAFEDSPSATVTITKVTDPTGGSDFRFTSRGFNPLQECPLDGGGDRMFALSDGESISCNVPQGNYSIKENIPQGYRLAIICLEAPDNIVINNETGEIDFTIVSSESVVDCIFTNIKKGNGGESCSIAPAGASNSFPLYLFIPALILIRRFVKRFKSQ